MLYTSRLRNELKNQLFISILIFLIVLFHFLDFAFFWCSAVIRFSNQYLNFFAFFFPSSPFLVADTQLYKRLCPLVRWSVGPLVRWSVGPCQRVEKWENERFRSFLCMCLCWKGRWMGRWVWMGVGCRCPPVRNDIVTPRHLF